MYYKPLENLNTEDTIQLNKIGAEESGKFGSQRQCEVLVNGSAMSWTLSAAKHGQLIEAGFKEGDTVRVQKWKEGMKKGYNFVSPDKSNPYAQVPNVPSMMHKNNPIEVEPSKKEYKDPMVERIIKGMCFNNACTLLASNSEIEKSYSSLKGIRMLSEDLHKEMYDWLTT